MCSVHDAGDCADVDDGPVQTDPASQDEADTRHVCLLVPPRSAAVYKGKLSSSHRSSYVQLFTCIFTLSGRYRWQLRQVLHVDQSKVSKFTLYRGLGDGF